MHHCNPNVLRNHENTLTPLPARRVRSGSRRRAVRASKPALPPRVAGQKRQNLPPVEEAAAKPAAETSSEKVVNVDAKTLLDNPQLLSRAMYSAVVSRNIAGIKVVLPIYEQWPGHDKNMALYARGLVAQDDGKMKEAIGYYRQFIAENPDAPVVRWQLATALFEDKQNEAAADQFDKLKTEANLPEPLVKGIESYRKALRERDSWKFNAGLSVTREQKHQPSPQPPHIRQLDFPRTHRRHRHQLPTRRREKMVAAQRLVRYGRRGQLRQNLSRTNQV